MQIRNVSFIHIDRHLHLTEIIDHNRARAGVSLPRHNVDRRNGTIHFRIDRAVFELLFCPFQCILRIQCSRLIGECLFGRAVFCGQLAFIRRAVRGFCSRALLLERTYAARNSLLRGLQGCLSGFSRGLCRIVIALRFGECGRNLVVLSGIIRKILLCLRECVRGVASFLRAFCSFCLCSVVICNLLVIFRFRFIIISHQLILLLVISLEGILICRLILIILSLGVRIFSHYRIIVLLRFTVLFDRHSRGCRCHRLLRQCRLCGRRQL